MSAATPDDRRWMTRALALAEQGLWSTDPNPRVGCVLARDGRVVAEGWHERAGGPHAEAAALAAAGEAARGATAYVTLEPCSHHGRTPPCAEALIAAGVQRVVYALRDPNPRVDGQGAARLAAAGVEVAGGLMAAEARAQNPGFLSRHERGRPWVRLKLAASLDGRTALSGGESRRITGEAARADVQALRARASAILTGSGTLLADDPRLDVRLPQAWRQPLRVVLDTRLRTPPGARAIAPPGRLAVFTASTDAARRAALEAAGATVECVPAGPGGLALGAVLARLAALEVNELHVECGATLAGAFLSGGLVDELMLYVAPLLLGDSARPLARLPGPASLAEARGFDVMDCRTIGTDLRVALRAARPAD